MAVQTWGSPLWPSGWGGFNGCSEDRRVKAVFPGYRFNRIVIMWLVATEQRRSSSGNLPSIKADTRRWYLCL